MKKTVFIKNAAVMTASSLILRLAGVVFKVWLASSVGAEGIGLYQLVFSVYVLAATFATSGICTAVTRLVADELELGRKSGVKKIMRSSLTLTLLVAAASILLLIVSADFIATNLLNDTRAAVSIKILSLSLPFMGISSCLRGYFLARRRATPPAAAQIFEQSARILIVILLVNRVSHLGMGVTTAAIIAGDSIAEALSAALLLAVYCKDTKKLDTLSGRTAPPFAPSREITRIALPITGGRYLNSLLRTAENILVPSSLAKFSGAGETALSQFGMIKGMALPLLFFPSTLLNSLSTLLIPEISSAATRGLRLVVKMSAERIIKITTLLAFPVAAVFSVASNEIGSLVYGESQVGFLLCALSPIVPLMYLDSVCDGILKGLDQQLFTFRTAIIDSSLRIVLVILVLPRFGLNGFIGIMYFSNLLTCLLNTSRLSRVSGAQINPLFSVVLPLLSALLAATLSRTVLLILPLPQIIYVILLCAFTVFAYFLLVLSFGCISSDEIREYVKI